MPELLQFDSNEQLPAQYGQQIRDFVRILWHDAYVYDLDAPVCPVDWNPHFCMLVDGPALISSATVVWKMIEHAGQSYKTFGLSGVLTYPAFRKKGHGRSVVDAATDYICTVGDADMAILWTHPDLHAFYAQSGWEHPAGITVTIGNPNSPHPFEGHLMMMFLSERAKTHRPDFEATPVYFGQYSW
jgi:GNAT superfamily N-acetyltransferase